MIVLEFEFSPQPEKKEKQPREGYVPPKTSIDAHNSIREMKSEHFAKITKALEELKIGGTYVEIGLQSGLDPIQVGRRLSEMESAGLVYNVGITRPTPTGRKAQVRQLVNLKA